MHRRIFFLLLVLLPLVFVAGLLKRHHWPAAPASDSSGDRP